VLDGWKVVKNAKEKNKDINDVIKKTLIKALFIFLKIDLLLSEVEK